MLSWVGSAVAALGAVLIIAYVWMTPFEGGPRTWEDKSYAIYYIVMALSAVVSLVLGALTRQRLFALVGMALALVTCGSSVDTLAFTFPEFEFVNAAFWVQPIGGLILAAGGLLAYLGHDFEPALAEHPVAAADVPAAQEPVATPAGWYPDPVGGGGQRYWDGNGWTDATK